MELSVYNQSGESVDSINLPEQLFGQDLRPDLLHRVIESARYNQQTPVAHTKDRRERSGGGTKPWRQKGTGRARHGSIRSPIWRKGGVTFGPKKSESQNRKVNKKEKRAGLVSALSAKHEDGEVLLVDELQFEQPQASQAREVLDSLGQVHGFSELSNRRNNAALIVVPEVDENTALSFRNFGNVAITKADNLHALDLLTYRYTVIVDPESVFTTIQNRLDDSSNNA